MLIFKFFMKKIISIFMKLKYKHTVIQSQEKAFFI